MNLSGLSCSLVKRWSLSTERNVNSRPGAFCLTLASIPQDFGSSTQCRPDPILQPHSHGCGDITRPPPTGAGCPKRFNPNPRSSTISEKCVGLSPTQSTEELTREHERTRLPSRWTRAERHLTAKQLPRPWRSCGLNTPAQALVVLALFALNVAFMLVSMPDILACALAHVGSLLKVKTVTFSGAQTASWNHLRESGHKTAPDIKQH